MPSRVVTAAIALLLCIASAAAADLSIAIGADVTSMDPHYVNLFPNNNIAEHIFEKADHARPRFAPDSRPRDHMEGNRSDHTWEFKLRQGVKFHDGSDFTAEDVAFSIDRVGKFRTAPAVHDSTASRSPRRSSSIRTRSDSRPRRPIR